jgi:hypothetical protein
VGLVRFKGLVAVLPLLRLFPYIRQKLKRFVEVRVEGGLVDRRARGLLRFRRRWRNGRAFSAAGFE